MRPGQEINKGELPIWKRSRASKDYLPINGPKHITNSALPTRCHPKADGNFSREQYSETVSVKLLNAEPRKNPQMDNHTISCVHSVCSAMTKNNRQLIND